MPFTPYHFGPSGLLGLIFKKWVDIPVFVLANVVIDIEVLVIGILGVGWPYHRYCHTLLFGALLGVIWGAAAYPLRNIFGRIMRLIRLPYQTGFWKMVISGVLGVWLHVVIDSIYHWDVLMLWPKKARPWFKLLSEGQVKAVCIACLLAAIILYAFISKSYMKKMRKNYGS